jgi:hypothetical protein
MPMNWKTAVNRTTYRCRVHGIPLRTVQWFGQVHLPRVPMLRQGRVNLLTNTMRLKPRVDALRRHGTFPSVRHVPHVVAGIMQPHSRLFAGRGSA